MLSDNIRNYRKKNNLSQDELAEKVGVSRQSVSFWETGQTQPTIDNIIALSKIFNISSDALLGNCETPEALQYKAPENKPETKKGNTGLIITVSLLVVFIIGAVILGNKLLSKDDNDNNKGTGSDISAIENINSEVSSGGGAVEGADKGGSSGGGAVEGADKVGSSGGGTPAEEQFDLFTYCKNFAIQKGELNGDYCIYQQPSTKYGGYENEYFSITYWGDSDRVEFCLHCPLSETQSHNFYITMRGGYNGKYEYSSSKYYRDTGESFRYAFGYIDPTVFSNSYPLSCDDYQGSTDGQNEFMEESRVGICDLIYCLKNFVKVENMECDFSDFDFVNF